MLTAIAGILIGAFNDWTGALLVPLAWGVTWCLRVWIFGAMSEREAEPGSLAARIGARRAFFLVEFATATSVALVFSVVTRGVLTLFGR